MSHCRCLGSILGQSMWHLCWTQCHWDRFFSKYFGFPLSVSFHQYSILIFIYMLLLSEGQMVKPGNLQSNALSEIGEHWIRKHFPNVFCWSSNGYLNITPQPVHSISLKRMNNEHEQQITQCNCNHPVMCIHVSAVAKWEINTVFHTYCTILTDQHKTKIKPAINIQYWSPVPNFTETHSLFCKYRMLRSCTMTKRDGWMDGWMDGWTERRLTSEGCSQGWPACQGHQYQWQPAGTVRVQILFSLQPFSSIHVSHSPVKTHWPITAYKWTCLLDCTEMCTILCLYVMLSVSASFTQNPACACLLYKLFLASHL